ncbi:hypothetical protein [Desulfovibrio cuneatus]|uniref:hypothetical protein n=1 Tax=Desulfovibrio cuneatus TaxID=159728 RepID=UPI00041F5183|nr:hypothetical protein [Desulfovibrio cuneatus]
MDAKQQNVRGAPCVWGVVACVLFLLAALAGLDALQSYWCTPSNEVALVGGESTVISGPMPKNAGKPQYLEPIWLGSAKLSFALEGESGNATSKKSTWKATLHAGNVQRVQTGTLVVEDLMLATEKETGSVTKIQNTDLVYSIVIYPSADAMKEAQPSILARYVGVTGGAVAAALAALGGGCAGVYWWLRRKAALVQGQSVLED